LIYQRLDVSAVDIASHYQFGGILDSSLVGIGET
jgi:hypothetical protein